MLNKWTLVSDLFFSHSAQIRIQNYGSTGKLKKIDDFVQFFNDFGAQNKEVESAEINYQLKGFKKNGKDTFNIDIPFSISFKEYYYTIKSELINLITIEEIYHQSLSEEDNEQIINAITDLIILTNEKSRPRVDGVRN